MTTSTATKVELNQTIRASIDNCDRLIEESYDLEFLEPADTRFFILMIAQEEAAKAFLLYLVREEFVPMSRELHRAINNHACKQMVGILLDYLLQKWETIAELDEQIRIDVELGELLPQDVRSVLEILAFEKVEAWRSGAPIWAEDPDYDRRVLKVSKGATDRRKQDALYVRLGKTGAIASVPGKIKPEQAKLALDTANEYSHFVERAAFGDQGQTSLRFEKVLRALRVVFRTGENAPSQ